MIGDIILAIKRVFEHNTCIHDYEYNSRIETIQETYFILKCSKCGKEKLI